jgi:transcriptional regulator with XRE-family HTH domain
MSGATDSDRPPQGGQRLLYWIAWTCRLLREANNASEARVADLAGVSVRVIDRFEQGDNWPRGLETIVAAYADVAGQEHSLKPWQTALDLWYQHGTLPMVSRRDDVQRDKTARTQKQIMEQIRQQVQRGLAEGRGAPARRSTAKKKRQANGH